MLILLAIINLLQSLTQCIQLWFAAPLPLHHGYKRQHLTVRKDQLDDAAVTEIRDSLNKGLAVGAGRFKDQIEATVARSVRPGQAGARKRLAG